MKSPLSINWRFWAVGGLALGGLLVISLAPVLSPRAATRTAPSMLPSPNPTARPAAAIVISPSPRLSPTNIIVGCPPGSVDVRTSGPDSTVQISCMSTRASEGSSSTNIQVDNQSQQSATGSGASNSSSSSTSINLTNP